MEHKLGFQNKNGKKEVCKLIFMNYDNNINESAISVVEIEKILKNYFKSFISDNTGSYFYKCYLSIVDSTSEAKNFPDFCKQMGKSKIGLSDYFYYIGRGHITDSSSEKTIKLAFYKL